MARASSDWYRLLELCALTDTLVVDEESIYDPGRYDDRLLLGFKGTLSEAELHWLRARPLDGKLAKAQRGALRVKLPTGLVYDPDRGGPGGDPARQRLRTTPPARLQQNLAKTSSTIRIELLLISLQVAKPCPPGALRIDRV